MKKVLIAVDDTKGSLRAVETFLDIYSVCPPKEVVLLFVQKIEGASLMDEMLGDAELSELKEMLKGTKYQEMLDKRAAKALKHFEHVLAEGGVSSGLKAIVREGHPADEILRAAEEEAAGMIIVGARSRKSHGFLMGSVSREVSNRAAVPVLVAR